MEFNEKLQELRKQKGLTQEELAEVLFVSRTAVSKWESGRGYPNLDSLKAIAGYFSISIDQLLSGEELRTLAQEDTKQSGRWIRELIIALLDIGAAILVILPLFAQKGDGTILEVSLLAWSSSAVYLRMTYFAVIFAMVLWGVCMLVLQNCNHPAWIRWNSRISLGINFVGVLVFIISLQPYAAIFLFVSLTIKSLLLLKKG